jgi:hypothetical protein
MCELKMIPEAQLRNACDDLATIQGLGSELSFDRADKIKVEDAALILILS